MRVSARVETHKEGVTVTTLSGDVDGCSTAVVSSPKLCTSCEQCGDAFCRASCSSSHQRCMLSQLGTSDHELTL